MDTKLLMHVITIWLNLMIVLQGMTGVIWLYWSGGEYINLCRIVYLFAWTIRNLVLHGWLRNSVLILVADSMRACAEGPVSNPEANCSYFMWAASKPRNKSLW